jgi:UDP-2,3-diacylglucosamine pyrophosphatase LpxH
MQSSARTRVDEAHARALQASLARGDSERSYAPPSIDSQSSAKAHKRCVEPAGEFDYVLLSDVHLGSDLVAHVRPWARTSWLTTEAAVDDQLVSLLEHQRRERPEGRPLCVVMAGDFLDLVGVSLTPPEGPLRTTPNFEEQQYGLGSAADHVVHKVWAIARRHPRVFRALMELCAEGNRLVVVRGNHDIELFWHSAQRALIDAICEHAPESTRASIAARIAIQPWFFVVEGLLYVEHGHQFDAMCSYGDPLLSTCPRDSRRIQQVPFSVMLRNVARPTRGLSTARYEHTSFGGYLGLLMALGCYGSLRIAVRFARAATCLVGTWLSHVRGDGGRRRHAAQVRKARFAAQAQLSAERLTALESLYVKPASHSLSFVLRSIYLDRVLAFACAGMFVVLAALVARSYGVWESVLCGLPAALLASYACIGVDRGIIPTRRMQTSAARIAELFGARWVVMGHTHQPVVQELAAGARYVNLGHWGEDDVPEERDQARTTTCTYLHVRLDGSPRASARSAGARYRADLMCWDAATGGSLAVLDNDGEALVSSPKNGLLPGVPQSI